MERETFFSGYCRQTDSSRTVAVEACDATLTYADCAYETCPNADVCSIGRCIRAFLQEE